MIGHPVLTFALAICGSVLLLLAFMALVWALGALAHYVGALLRGLNLRALIWRWRRDASWRAAEREQRQRDAARHARIMATYWRATVRDALLAPPIGDSRGALLAAQWAIADAAKRSESAAEAGSEAPR